MRETDVLIIGGGLAGLNAAAELRDSFPGLSFLIADCTGCASTEIMGFCAPVASGDSVAQFYQDILRSGNGRNSPELAQILAERAVAELERLEKLGLRFDRNPDGTRAAIHSVGSSFPRVVHSGTSTGKQAMELLKQPLLHRRVVKLIVVSNTLRGAVLEGGEIIRCKAAVIAGGGFAGLWKFSTWSKNLQGDSLVLAHDAGCSLCALDCVQFEPTVTVYPEKAHSFPVITTVLHEGAKLYDRTGRSLVPDKVPPKRELAKIIQLAIQSGHAFPHGGVMYDFSGVDEDSFRRKYPDYYRKYLRWFQDFSQVKFEVRPAAHTTLGGIRIGPDCSTGVTGIFAAGEAVGNLHGADRLGGNAGSEVFVFGRIAGKSAGKYAAECRFRDIPEDGVFRPAVISDPMVFVRIRDILDRYFTVLPDRGLCRMGLDELKALPSCGIVEIIRQAFSERLKRIE
jgi:aspartate oxidase